jgi:O-acetyl-ADP-ribose deacetylase (regulator of RNase III)
MNPEHLSVVQGDLLDQPVDVIVNAWNRNIIPWWLLIPQGVSGAIKRKAGYQPFRELGRKGAIPLGGAVITSAGRLTYKAIIHVAGINMWWRSSEQAIRHSVKNALALAQQEGLQSIAFPLIGAGTGGFSEPEALALMQDEVLKSDYSGNVVIVQFRPSGS